jgi:DNA-binding MarR family transcriptional regulator
MDGNLALWKHDDHLASLRPDANKFRGPGFEPITFKLEKITTPELVDRKGRLLPTVQAVAISEREEEQQAEEAEHDEDQLLEELDRDPDRSVADLARACGWLLSNGEPHKSKTDRVLTRLVADKLIKKVRGRRYRSTPEGKKALKALKGDDDETEQRIEDRSGALSKKPFHPLRGMKQRDTVPCAYCGKIGHVYGFADGRLPSGQRHHAHLHAECAEPYFTGKPKPGATGNGGDITSDHDSLSFDEQPL